MASNCWKAGGLTDVIHADGGKLKAIPPSRNVSSGSCAMLLQSIVNAPMLLSYESCCIACMWRRGGIESWLPKLWSCTNFGQH